MSVKLGRAAIRALVPNQKVEITITIFAEQSVQNVVIEEELKEGFTFVHNSEQKIRKFTPKEFSELIFIPKGHARSISYWVKVDMTTEEFVEKYPDGFAKIQIAGRVRAITLHGREVKSKIKTSNFHVFAPKVIVDTIEVLENGDLALVVRNVGNIDAKKVIITINVLLDLLRKKIMKFEITVTNEDYLSNVYNIYRDFSESSLIGEDLVNSLMNLFAHSKTKEVFSKYKQEEPISVEADRRNRLIYATPIAK